MTMNNRIPPPIVGLLTALLMWVAARQIAALDFAFRGQQAVAGVLAALGIAIELVSIIAFFRARTTVNPLAPQRAEALVVTGLYRFSRNPMYLGMAILLVGWGIWLGNAASIALVLLFTGFITRFQIKPEEAALSDSFGDDYRAYCAKVRRWI